MIRSAAMMLGLCLACCVLAGPVSADKYFASGVPGDNDDGLGPPPPKEEPSTEEPSASLEFPVRDYRRMARSAERPVAYAPGPSASAPPPEAASDSTSGHEAKGRAVLLAISSNAATLLEHDEALSGSPASDQRILFTYERDDLVKMKSLADHFLAEGISPSGYREHAIRQGVPRTFFEYVVDGMTRPTFKVDDKRILFRPAGGMDASLTPQVRTMLEDAQRSVCLIRGVRKQGTDRFEYRGTGFRVGTRYIVTNRHVVDGDSNEDFPFLASRTAEGKFVPNSNLSIFVDFGDNRRGSPSVAVPVNEIVYYRPENRDGSDIAVLGLADPEVPGTIIPPPLGIDWEQAPEFRFPVGTIGFPAPDPRVNTIRVAGAYGSVRDLFAKFVAVGMAYDRGQQPCEYTDDSVRHPYIFHDCSTLGGCSGSPVINLETGKVVALHFAGTSSCGEEKCPDHQNGNMAMLFSQMPEAAELKEILSK